MKKAFLAMSLILVCASITYAQEFGLSFSYFIPRNGYFSTPISPFSIRGVGVSLSKHLAIETGASLYRMSGLNIIDMPVTSKNPLLGPNFTLFVPVELVLEFKGRSSALAIKGGGFAFYGFAQKLNEGNFDRAIRTYENWDVANSDFHFKNHPGIGFHAGTEFTFTVTRQFGISIEVNYLAGKASLPIQGTYTGGNIAGSLQTNKVDFKDAHVDFTGFEFSLGIIFYGR